MNRWVGLSLVLGLTACGSSGDVNNGNSRDGGDALGKGDARAPDNEFTDARPVNNDGACDKMDLLFVVDSSPSMLSKQRKLADNFPGFIEVLDRYVTGSGDPLDYRVAVATSGVTRKWETGPIGRESQDGRDGVFVQNPDCNMARPWIERADGNVTDTFACNAMVGSDGPKYEMPLEGMHLALSDRMDDGTNAGFRRDDALFGLIILTDEDDCSHAEDGFRDKNDDICDPGEPDPVADHVSFLDTYTGGREHYAVAAIAGDASCANPLLGLDFAKNAVRVQDFVTQVGENAIFSRICQKEFSQALDDAVATFEEACRKLPVID